MIQHIKNMEIKNIPGIFIDEDNVYDIIELKNKEFPYYHLQRGWNNQKKEKVNIGVFACKIISISIKDNLNIAAITIQFKSGGKFCILQDIDKKMFFKLNKKLCEKNYYNSKGEAVKILINNY